MMRTKVMTMAVCVGLFIFAACSKNDKEHPPPEQQQKEEPIQAQNFFKQNHVKAGIREIDGDAAEDILIAGIAKGDVNGDGNQDILIAGQAAGKIRDIDGDAAEDILIAGITKKDINGDGNQDILITGYEQKEVASIEDIDGDATSDILIAGLTIPPHSFLTEDGKKVKGKIQIATRLLVTKNDLIFSQTDSKTKDGQFFNSKLMVYINATQDGKQLKINPERVKNPDAPKITLRILNFDPGKSAVYFSAISSDVVDNPLYEEEGEANNPLYEGEGFARPVDPQIDGDDAIIPIEDLGTYVFGSLIFSNTQSTDITVEIKGDGLKDIKDLHLWLVWENENTAVELNPFDKKEDMWISKDNQAPIGETPVLAIMGENKDGGLIMEKKRLEVKDNGVYTLIAK